MSDKKSVSAFRVLKSSIIEIKNDPLMYSIFLFPVYLLSLISFSYDDFIIVNNQDFAFYKYSSNSYLIGLLYALVESYIFAIIAVSIHNKIIKRNTTLKLFSKGIIIYAVFYLANHAEFLGYLIYNNLTISFAVIINLALGLLWMIFYITSFLWLLYLPNISVNDKKSFFYIFKNSYGARLTIIVQAVYLIPIFLIPYLILTLLGGIKFGIIFTVPFIFVLAVTMLSHTYLEWQELERNTAEKNK